MVINKTGKQIIVSRSGFLRTYLDGKLHSFDDKPSRVSYDGKVKIWHKNGIIHRDGDKPAVIKDTVEITPSGVEKHIFVKHWYKKGVSHRDGDKPASIWHEKHFSNGQIVTDYSAKYWYVNGRKTRLSNKPSDVSVSTHQYFSPNSSVKECHKSSIKIWYVNGEKHRDNGPAFVSLGKTFLDEEIISVGKEIFYYKKDMLHRDGDKPARFVKHLTSDSESIRMFFYQEDKLHREGDKPAILQVSIKDNIETRDEKYYVNGLEHRDGDKPAIILKDPNEGLDLVKYYRNGKYHRDGDKPALVVNVDDKTYFKFYQNGIDTNNYKDFLGQLVLQDLKNNVSGWEDIQLGDYPVDIMNSILFAATGIEYSLDMPGKYLLKWW